LVRNLARRLEQVAPGISASILEGLDKMLTVIRLGLPLSLRRSLACTNIIENMTQRQRLARRIDGTARDRGCDAGSSQSFPALEGMQAASDAACGPRCTSKQART
jgi:hypothetical protein